MSRHFLGGQRIMSTMIVSNRLFPSPHHTVISRYSTDILNGLSHLQALADARAAEYMKGRKVLEINPSHPIIQSLNDNYSGDQQNATVRLLVPSTFLHKEALPSVITLTLPVLFTILPPGYCPVHTNLAIWWVCFIGFRINCYAEDNWYWLDSS